MNKMEIKKLNCWEYKKCGREPGGVNVDKSGVCPAATDTSFDKINSGECGGRFCWAVNGTLCNDKVQGTYEEKRKDCLRCGFYHRVRGEEGTANLRTKFLQFLPLDGESPLFTGMSHKYIKAGTRFFVQGEAGDTAYIIQYGTCLLIVEKDGELHPVGHRSEGDIVDLKSLLTGEPRSAHAEAETDMEVWELNKSMFDNLSKKDPDLLSFFTELVSDRFDSRRPIAERTIGKYVATDIIGRGGFSIVYKGVHVNLNRQVAIKMLRHDMATEEDFLNTFHNEAKTIAGLNHENIINVYDIEEHFKTVFIIMEFVDGESLHDLLCRLKTIPLQLLVQFLIQIFSGLEYAHSKGIIHRDMNLTNVLIQYKDRLKILDFGLSCPIGTEDFYSSGTAYYMAPEQINSETLDQRTDIYAAGIMAYQMITGVHPFRGKKIEDLMEINENDEVPDPSLIKPSIPKKLSEFVLKACRRKPEERFQSASDALEYLHPLSNKLSLLQTDPNNDIETSMNFTITYKDNNIDKVNKFLDEMHEKASALGIGIVINKNGKKKT